MTKTKRISCQTKDIYLSEQMKIEGGRARVGDSGVANMPRTASIVCGGGGGGGVLRLHRMRACSPCSPDNLADLKLSSILPDVSDES